MIAIRLRYYFGGVLAILIGAPVLSLLGTSFINGMFFFLSFWWNFTLLAPDIKARISKKNYRFSFLRVIYKANLFLYQQLYNQRNKYLKIVLRWIIPFAFVVMVAALSNQGNPIFSVIGLLYFEVVFLVMKFLSSRVCLPSKDA